MKEKERYVGCYIPNNLYIKLKLFCVKKDISITKALLTLIITLVKDVKLDSEINNETESTVKS